MSKPMRIDPRWISWTAMLFVLCLPWMGAGAEQSVRPGINKPYEDADVAYWTGVFEHEGREVYARRAEILDALDPKPGMTVADIGAGTGFYSLMLAQAVGPAGHVYAVDISPGFVAAIERRADAAGLDNLSAVLGTVEAVNLPDQAIDLAFICDTYHHFEYPSTMMASLNRALRPGGEVVVVDYRREPGRSTGWVMGHVRAGAEQVWQEITAAGFDLVEERDFLRTQYYLRFRKRPTE